MSYKIKHIFIIILLFFLIYSRFIHLSWGLPYLMHPDERNMALALIRLSPNTLFYPDFFAYGQFPLYLGYILLQLYFFIFGLSNHITLTQAVVILRFISACASLIAFFILLSIFNKLAFFEKHEESFRFYCRIGAGLIIIFSPYAIQFAHFGTTESLLMMFYCIIAYLSLLFLENEAFYKKYLLLCSFFCGIAISTKVSAGEFCIVPIIIFMLKKIKEKKYTIFLFNKLKTLSIFFIVTAVIAIIFSPYNILSFREFIRSMNYESDVAFGQPMVFYTRQFDGSIPFLFQIFKIFPYALGLLVFVLFLFGFFFLSWKKKEYNFIRFSLLIYLIPQLFLFAKWTRFMAPIFPIMTLFAILFFIKIISHISKNIHFHFIVKNCIFIFITIAIILPGVAYLSIYRSPDVRLKASNWIYKNIPEKAFILSETANVVDIPIHDSQNDFTKDYHIISFDFYDVDSDIVLMRALNDYIGRADYVFIPSRRIFMNSACAGEEKAVNTLSQVYDGKINSQRCKYLLKRYPVLNAYYQKLFDGALGFKKIAEFTSYPTISFFGKTILSFPDENAEETWTVFDHPVIRIYKRKNI